VYIVKKEDQRTGKETRGAVSRLLTKSSYHPRGIKVMLANGVVGRVTRFTDGDINNNIQLKKKKKSLSDYLKEEGVDEQLSSIVMAAASASSQIANELRNLPLLDDADDEEGGNINVQGEEQKGMDVRANKIFIQQLKPYVSLLVSEEEEDIVDGTKDRRYSIAFDPLDGSSNLDVTSPTGTIFGIYQRNNNVMGSSDSSSFGLPARQSLVAAGYTIYSSATEFVLAGLGKTVVGFTLDTEDNVFRCSRPDIICPDRGPYYSLNEAREPDWPDGLRQWVEDAKRGQTPAGNTYSSRYVCSLTADVHRTLLKGGWAGNPRPHLRLLYEAAPLAFILEAAGGRGIDGINNLLDIKPTNLHQRVPCFLGSKFDIADLEAYGDMQQKSKRYES
jgi:fructose-1,6-bisphosphatase I